jgi:hypothetical protein
VDGAARFARWVLLVVALAFAAPGLGFLFAPTRFAAAVDVALLGPTGFSDARAVLGGLEVGLAVFLASCALSVAWQHAGLLAASCALGGMIAGRVGSLLHDGMPGAFGWLLVAIEIALALAVLIALARLWLARDAGPQVG